MDLVELGSLSVEALLQLRRGALTGRAKLRHQIGRLHNATLLRSFTVRAAKKDFGEILRVTSKLFKYQYAKIKIAICTMNLNELVRIYEMKSMRKYEISAHCSCQLLANVWNKNMSSFSILLLHPPSSAIHWMGKADQKMHESKTFTGNFRQKNIN